MATFTFEELQKKHPGETPKQSFTFEELKQKSEQNIQENSGVGGFVTGVGKSGLSLLQGVGQLGRGIQKGIAGAVGAEGALGEDSPFDEDTESGQRLEELTTPRTTSEKIGKFVGDVAQFVIPGTAAAKLTRGAKLAKVAGGQGISDALVQTAQQGEFNRNTVDTAILGAAFPGAGKGLSILKRKLAPNAGGKVINSLIKPLLKDFSYGKNPGKAVAEAGITANSLDDLGEKIAVARTKAGSEIGEKIAGNTNVFDMTSGFSPIDDAIQKAQLNPRTNSTVLNRLNDLKNDLLRVTTNESGQDVVGRNLQDISALEVFDIKKEIGDLTRWTGNATDDEIVNKALKQTYGKFKGALDDAVEGIKPLNEKYANLSSAEVATRYRDKIAARQNLISLSGSQAGLGAAVATAILSGGAALPTILVGATAAALIQASKTPAVKTRLASWLASASKEEIESVFKQAPFMRATLQTILFGEETEDSNNR